MSYAYYTEPLYREEKVLERTTAASADQVRTIGQRFTELSAQGLEFVRSIDVPVVGKVFKSEGAPVGSCRGVQESRGRIGPRNSVGGPYWT